MALDPARRRRNLPTGDMKPEFESPPELPLRAHELIRSLGCSRRDSNPWLSLHSTLGFDDSPERFRGTVTYTEAEPVPPAGHEPRIDPHAHHVLTALEGLRDSLLPPA
jgi:hypothetical protein